ncbi:alkaline phosphatase family protein [Bartonella tamiae]|uniref:Nucleotide pyrophosphatase n=1 Tax=Bartonella tamiae Th239 TaxID=1094558 RepID=J0R496_9HYPH|nr:alkaline phosphatase family protein [Bartonella tamiae]EJF90454.1 hypothetical protein ME5_00855 [Bartonella tamiae Th239]EJF93602.1 hypothetical protein MEG_01026 [Bartonella tamiae Th307]
MSKLILIVLDGLRYDTARQCLGYLEAKVSAQQAQCTAINCELPAISRPLYETILTGRTPLDHGIVSNAITRKSNENSIFSLARKANLKTAAAAYHWVSELYVKTPFNPIEDRLLINSHEPIQYGMFYWQDDYPDSHLFADAEMLIKCFNPDFLMLHPMNIDDAGHKYGGNSINYRNAARKASDLLANYLPLWLDKEYKIIITSDHGMSDEGNHGGPELSETKVPFYNLGFQINEPVNLAQIQIADLCCKILNIPNEIFTPFVGTITL